MSNQVSTITAVDSMQQLQVRLSSAAERIVHNATIHLCKETGSTLLYEATYEDVKNLISPNDYIRYFPMLVSEVKDIFSVREVNACLRTELWPGNISKTPYKPEKILLEKDVMKLGLDVLVERQPEPVCDPASVESVMQEFLFGNPPVDTIAVRYKNSCNTNIYAKIPCGNSGKVWALYWERVEGWNSDQIKENTFKWNPILPCDMRLIGYISSNKEIITNSCISWVENAFPMDCRLNENIKRLHDVCSEMENKIYSHVKHNMTVEDFEEYAVSNKQKSAYEKYSKWEVPDDAGDVLLNNVEREFGKGKTEFSAYSRGNRGLFSMNGLFSMMNVKRKDSLTLYTSQATALTLSELACRYLIDKEDAFNWCLNFFLQDNSHYEVALKQKVFTALGNRYLKELIELYESPFVADGIPEELKYFFAERQIRETLTLLSSEANAKTVTVTFTGKRKKEFSMKVPIAELLEKGFIPLTGSSSDVKATLILADLPALDIHDIRSIVYRGKQVWALNCQPA